MEPILLAGIAYASGIFTLVLLAWLLKALGLMRDYALEASLKNELDTMQVKVRAEVDGILRVQREEYQKIVTHLDGQLQIVKMMQEKINLWDRTTMGIPPSQEMEINAVDPGGLQR